MNDRELLELAAKAAGVHGGWVEKSPEDGHPMYSCGIGRAGIVPLWNPLADDGDALRLAVKLGILIDTSDGVYSQYVLDGIGYPIFEYEFDDLYSSTRRVIVRAAAEIGKSMANKS